MVTSAHELSHHQEDGPTVTISSTSVIYLLSASAGLWHPGTDLCSVVLTSEQPVGPTQLTWKEYPERITYSLH